MIEPLSLKRKTWSPVPPAEFLRTINVELCWGVEGVEGGAPGPVVLPGAVGVGLPPVAGGDPAPVGDGASDVAGITPPAHPASVICKHIPRARISRREIGATIPVRSTTKLLRTGR